MSVPVVDHLAPASGPHRPANACPSGSGTRSSDVALPTEATVRAERSAA